MNAIDIDGIGVDGSLTDQPSPKPSSVANAALHLVADPTGGTVFENSNDLHGDFERMMHQQEVLYVLSFQAQSSKPGRLHQLSVRAIDVFGSRVKNRLAYQGAG
jgi:hypothetical protein